MREDNIFESADLPDGANQRGNSVRWGTGGSKEA